VTINPHPDRPFAACWVAFLPRLTDAWRCAISQVMTNEQKIDGWVDVITAYNGRSTEAWTARFIIDGVWLVEQCVTELETLNATLAPNGPDTEYVVRFDAPTVREVVGIVAEQNGWLCERQELVPIP
jgi:hypothetical protein